MTLRRAALYALCAACVALPLGGCGLFGPTKASLRSVAVVAQAHANRDSATALDLVFIYDGTTAATLPRTGPTWFQQKGALTTALGQRIDVASLQLPPGQSVDPVALPSRYKKALTVYCYVNFVAPAGQGVADVTLYKKLLITLGRDTVTYASR